MKKLLLFSLLVNSTYYISCMEHEQPIAESIFIGDSKRVICKNLSFQDIHALRATNKSIYKAIDEELYFLNKTKIIKINSLKKNHSSWATLNTRDTRLLASLYFNESEKLEALNLVSKPESDDIHCFYKNDVLLFKKILLSQDSLSNCENIENIITNHPNKNIVFEVHNKINKMKVKMLLGILARNNAYVTYSISILNQILLHIAETEDAITNSILLLLEHGADVNSTTNNTTITPLYWAYRNNNRELAQLLIDHGSDINNIDHKEFLYWAYRNNNRELAQLLIDHGSDINNIDHKEFLYWACRNNSRELAQLLIDHGSDINNIDHKEFLYWACRNNSRELTQLLIDHGADVNSTNSSKLTPLYWACRNNNRELAQFLIDHGSDVNSTDNNYCLHWACRNNNRELTQLLIDHGANVNSTNNKKTTPLWWAYKNNNRELAQLLIDHGANDNSDFHQK